MRFQTASSTVSDLEEALSDCFASFDTPEDASIYFIFTSGHQSHRLPEILASNQPHIASDKVFGCSSSGVLGGPRSGVDMLGVTAVSVTAARLPDAKLHMFHTNNPDLPDLPDLEEKLLVENPHFIVLGTHSFPMDRFLGPVDASFPLGAKIGGIASGQPPALFANGRVYSEGAVGLAMQGVRMDTVISQGCRGMGQPVKVTRAESGVVMQVEGVPAVAWLQRAAQQLGSDLLLGISMASRDDTDTARAQGPFLIRHIQDRGFGLSLLTVYSSCFDVDVDSSVVVCVTMLSPGCC